MGQKSETACMFCPVWPTIAWDWVMHFRSPEEGVWLVVLRKGHECKRSTDTPGAAQPISVRPSIESISVHLVCCSRSFSSIFNMSSLHQYLVSSCPLMMMSLGEVTDWSQELPHTSAHCVVSGVYNLLCSLLGKYSSGNSWQRWPNMYEHEGGVFSRCETWVLIFDEGFWCLPPRGHFFCCCSFAIFNDFGSLLPLPYMCTISWINIMIILAEWVHRGLTTKPHHNLWCQLFSCVLLWNWYCGF